MDELLYEAINSGNCDAIAALLIRLGGPSYRTKYGETCLALAVSSDFGPSGTLQRVNCLLNLGAKVADEDPRDGLGTSVHRATSNGHIGTLVALLARDGSCALDSFDDLGRTPLICAVQASNTEAARMLLAAGSNVDLHDETMSGDTALIYAVRGGNLELVELLISFGASPKVRGWMQLNAFDQIEEDGRDIWPRIRKRLEAATSQQIPLS